MTDARPSQGFRSDRRRWRGSGIIGVSSCGRKVDQVSRIRRKEHDMKPGIHPEYHEVTVHCACGATWTTHSTKKDLHLEICSNCHPFFTGRQKLIDTEGRVDRFTKKFGAQTVESRKTAAKVAKAKKTAVKKTN
jgi:large subunit ribosomal protein L31